MTADAIQAAVDRLAKRVEERTGTLSRSPVVDDVATVLEAFADARRQIAERDEALKPFAAVSEKAKGKDDACWCGQDGAVIRYSDLRRAAALLSKGSEEPAVGEKS